MFEKFIYKDIILYKVVFMTDSKIEEIEPKEKLEYKDKKLKIEIYSRKKRWKHKEMNYTLEDLFPSEYVVKTPDGEKIFKNDYEVREYLNELISKNSKK
jgi:hypothetical protein